MVNNRKEASKSDTSAPPCENTKESSSGSDIIKEVSSVEGDKSVKEN
jgi:Ataxin-3